MPMIKFELVMVAIFLSGCAFLGDYSGSHPWIF
jgi:hypothetical protein